MSHAQGYIKLRTGKYTRKQVGYLTIWERMETAKGLIITTVIALLLTLGGLYVTNAQVCAGRYVGDPQATCKPIFGN